MSLNTQALARYYTSNGAGCNANGVCDVGIPGVSVVQGLADDENPNALPLAATVINPYANAASLLGSGVDITATARVPLGGKLRWTASGSASYLDKLQLTDATGAVQKWAGSLSLCNITSCSGAPRWRASLSNTLEIEDLASLTLTAYYTSGYKLEATDLGGVYGHCQASIGAAVVTYADGATPIRCSTKSTFNLDANLSFKIDKRFTFYINALNILDIKPPYDPSAGYSLYNFNPAWADSNFMGRYFRIGAKVDF